MVAVGVAGNQSMVGVGGALGALVGEINGASVTLAADAQAIVPAPSKSKPKIKRPIFNCVRLPPDRVQGRPKPAGPVRRSNLQCDERRRAPGAANPSSGALL